MWWRKVRWWQWVFNSNVVTCWKLWNLTSSFLLMKIIFSHISEWWAYVLGNISWAVSNILEIIFRIIWSEQLRLSYPGDSCHPSQVGLLVLCSFFPCLLSSGCIPNMIMYLGFLILLGLSFLKISQTWHGCKSASHWHPITWEW